MAQSNTLVLAEVNGFPVTDVDVRVAAARGGYDTYNPQEAQLALDDVIAHELFAAEAKAKGYFDDPEILRMVKNLAVQKLVKDQVDGQLERIVNTEEELRAYYDANPKEFRKPTVARAQLLLLKPEEDAQALLVEAKEGRVGFGELVKEHSADVAARANGGISGWVVEDGDNRRYDPALVEAILSCTPGQVTGPLVTGKGSYLIKGVDRHEGVVTPYEQAKRNISRMIAAEKRRALYREYTNTLREKYDVEINQKAFDAFRSTPVVEDPNNPPLGPVRVKGGLGIARPPESKN